MRLSDNVQTRESTCCDPGSRTRPERGPPQTPRAPWAAGVTAGGHGASLRLGREFRNHSIANGPNATEPFTAKGTIPVFCEFHLHGKEKGEEDTRRRRAPPPAGAPACAHSAALSRSGERAAPAGLARR